MGAAFGVEEPAGRGRSGLSLDRSVFCGDFRRGVWLGPSLGRREDKWFVGFKEVGGGLDNGHGLAGADAIAAGEQGRE